MTIHERVPVVDLPGLAWLKRRGDVIDTSSQPAFELKSRQNEMGEYEAIDVKFNGPRTAIVYYSADGIAHKSEPLAEFQINAHPTVGKRFEYVPGDSEQTPPKRAQRRVLGNYPPRRWW